MSSILVPVAIISVPIAAHAQSSPIGAAPIGQSAGAADSSTTLSEVVVTAQFRTENTQAVPISVTSVSGKALENSGFQSITDLQYLVPGVQYDPTQGSNFLIRGVGLLNYDFSFEKSVSVVVDGVVMDAQRDNGLIGIEDIDRIDVLLGPQGTVFGKNATSGVISVITGAPVLNTWSAKTYAAYGERNDLTLNTTINAPVGSDMALRVSLFDQGQDGFGKYTTLGKTLGAVSEYGVRAKLLYQPNGGFDVTLAGDWAHHYDTSIRTAVSGASSTVTAAEIALGVTPGPNNANTADSQLGAINYDEFGAAMTAHYKLGSNTVTSITAVRGTNYENAAPVDLVPTSISAYSTYSTGFLATKKVSEELRLASPTGGFIEYVAGIFYNDLAARQFQYQWGPFPLAGPFTPATTTIYCFSCVNINSTTVSDNTQRFVTDNLTVAEFGQLKFNFTPNLILTLGARNSYDRSSQSLNFVNFNADEIIGTNNNYTFVTTNKAPNFYSGSTSGDSFTYRISPEYKFSNNAMVYFTAATGNKPAGIALNGNVFAPYRAETVLDFEVGEKSEWFNHRLRINFDLYHSQYKNYQAPALTQIPAGPTNFISVTAIGNAGGLLSEGAEASVAFKPTNELTLSGSGSYNDSYFTNYIDSTTVNYTGTRPPNAPKWTGTLAADYVKPISDNLGLAAHLDYDYRGKQWDIVGDPAYSLVKGYGLLNARVSFRLSNTGFQFGVYARNLFDTHFQTGFQQYGVEGLLHFTSPDSYRTVGVFGKYAF